MSMNFGWGWIFIVAMTVFLVQNIVFIVLGTPTITSPHKVKVQALIWNLSLVVAFTYLLFAHDPFHIKPDDWENVILKVACIGVIAGCLKDCRKIIRAIRNERAVKSTLNDIIHNG